MNEYCFLPLESTCYLIKLQCFPTFTLTSFVTSSPDLTPSLSRVQFRQALCAPVSCSIFCVSASPLDRGGVFLPSAWHEASNVSDRMNEASNQTYV